MSPGLDTDGELNSGDWGAVEEARLPCRGSESGDGDSVCGCGPVWMRLRPCLAEDDVMIPEPAVGPAYGAHALCVCLC